MKQLCGKPYNIKLEDKLLGLEKEGLFRLEFLVKLG